MLDVVVVGAGLSGLSAARLLAAQGLSVVVLEARDRVGGRTYTVHDPAFGYTDLGGSYVGPLQRRIARLAKELDVDFYKINVTGRAIMKYGNSWRLFKDDFPIYNPFHMMDLINLSRNIDKMSMEIDESWKSRRAKEWDRVTLKEFLDKTCWTKFAHDMGTMICRSILCAETHEVSLLCLIAAVKYGHGIARVIGITNGSQERKVVGGSMQLSERMADQLPNKVKLSSPVIRIEQSSSQVNLHTATSEVFSAKYAISSVPLPLLNRITFAPPLPHTKLQLIQRAPMGSVIKTMMFYERAYWRERDLSGEVVCDVGPAYVCLDDTKPDGSHPCIVALIYANEAVKFSRLTSDQRKQKLAERYAELYRCPELLHPVNYVEKNWAEDEYSGGCYSSYTAPGTITEFMPVVREPFLRTHFAGTETATDWDGYMEGAIESGQRAAREVLVDMGRMSREDAAEEEKFDEDVHFPELPVDVSAVERYMPSVPQFLALSALLLAVGLGGIVGYSALSK